MSPLQDSLRLPPSARARPRVLMGLLFYAQRVRLARHVRQDSLGSRLKSFFAGGNN